MVLTSCENNSIQLAIASYKSNKNNEEKKTGRIEKNLTYLQNLTYLHCNAQIFNTKYTKNLFIKHESLQIRCTLVSQISTSSYQEDLKITLFKNPSQTLLTPLPATKFTWT